MLFVFVFREMISELRRRVYLKYIGLCGDVLLEGQVS